MAVTFEKRTSCPAPLHCGHREGTERIAHGACSVESKGTIATSSAVLLDRRPFDDRLNNAKPCCPWKYHTR